MINIVTCAWNAEKYIDICIDSVLFQKYTDYKMFIVDDISTDKTVEVIKKKINGDSRFQLIENTEKKFKLKNFDDILSNEKLINAEDIIVELDGDDWLYHDNVLGLVTNIYKTSPNLLIANGKFAYSNGTLGFSNDVNISLVRTSSFCFSHLRTWKASLWRQVDKRYFIDPNSNTGSYFKIAADMAYSLPMLEIAGQYRYSHIPEVLLVYNETSPYNDHKTGSASGGREEQLNADTAIRKLKYRT
jgi:glycosyltransferase involved in cell wall biosynthesis